MPLVSVIIPYHQKKKYFKSTLKSVLTQTFQDYEIIIVYNDKNYDDLDYIKTLIKKNKKILLVIKKKNLGAGMARNLGIKNSKGKFIAFLDSDDLWKKNKLEKQIMFMKKNKFEISHTAYEVKKDNKKKIINSKTFYNYLELLKACSIGLSTIIVKKKFFTQNRFSNLKTHEDFLLWLQILKKGYKIHYLNRNLTTWRYTKNSLSSNYLQKIKDAFNVYYNFMKFNYFKSIYFLIILSFNSIKKKLN